MTKPYKPGESEKQFIRDRLQSKELRLSLIEHQLRLAMGVPQVHKLPDGSESKPVLVTPDVQLRAVEGLLDRSMGRAPGATELVAAEVQAREQDQLAAMSEAELVAFIEGAATRLDEPAPALPETTAPVVTLGPPPRAPEGRSVRALLLRIRSGKK